MPSLYEKVRQAQEQTRVKPIAPVRTGPLGPSVSEKLNLGRQPQGFLKTTIKTASKAAVPAVKSYLETEQTKRAGMSLGERFQQDIIKRPASIVKFLVQGVASIPLALGRSGQELLGVETISTPTAKEWERKIFGTEVESYQELTRNIQSLIDVSPESTPGEKEFLAPVIGAAIFASDIFPGKPGTKKLAKKLFADLATDTNVSSIEKKLIINGIEKNSAARLAPEIVKQKSEKAVRDLIIKDSATQISKAVDTGKLDQETSSLFEKVKASVEPEAPPTKISKELPEARKIAPEPATPTQTIKRAETKIVDGDAPFFRSEQGKFVEIPEKNILPAPIKENVDTFIVKEGDKFMVVEGKTGRVIGTPEATIKEAIASGKRSLDELGESLQKVIDTSPLSPRYAQVDAPVPKTKELTRITDSKIDPDKELVGREYNIVNAEYRKFQEGLDVDDDLILKLPRGSSIRSTVKSMQNAGILGQEKDFIEAIATALRKSDQPSPSKKKTPPKIKGVTTADKITPSKKLTTEKFTTEEDSLSMMAEEVAGEAEYRLHASAVEEEKVVTNLERIFADMKGVKVDDLKLRFTPEEIHNAEVNYELLTESLLDDPARSLQKYVVPHFAEKELKNFKGLLPEVTGIAPDSTLATKLMGKKGIKPHLDFKKRGDDIVTELGFADAESAREAFELYKIRKAESQELFKSIREIRQNVRLAKQTDTFVGKQVTKLSTKLKSELTTLNNLVKTAEKTGFRKGIAAGGKKYETLVKRLSDRRHKITALRHAYNLTDGQMKKIRGNADPRFMDKTEFSEYLTKLEEKAAHVQKLEEEKVIIHAIIDEKGLEKTENLQRALELPPIKDMSLEQLFEFDEALSKTAPYSTFLGPRMIQTAANTDLGAIKTIQEGIEAVSKQIGMDPKDIKPVQGSKVDRWLRDPTLVEKDPLHKMFITEWVANEASMLNRKHLLRQDVDKLAAASRKSRNRTVAEKLVPQDHKVVEYAETPEGGLSQLEKTMTPEEIEFGKFSRDFYKKYYTMVQEDANNRWTLRGVKHSRFKDLYFPHLTRGFFERFKDDGFVKAVKILFDTNVADTKIDFNAFGDKGQVLGYEKFMKQNLKREGDGAFSQNAASAMLSYFDTFEKKLLLDSQIPKIKLLEFLLGKRFKTPKSINNPLGTEKIHSQLTKSINEWINNKKGQRVEMLYEQGDRIESFVDSASLLVSLQDLGGNISTQVGSGVGGELMSLRGAKTFKDWGKGHALSLTRQGRKIGRENVGIIGEHPWYNLANAQNDIGDTLISALFYVFGDMAFRAKRQMMLGMLTKKEFKTGIITPMRQAEIKLKIGAWHPMPEFKSVAGSTSAVKALGKYTDWATPGFQTSTTDLSKMIKAAKKAKKEGGVKGLETFLKSKNFQNTIRTIVTGIGAYAFGQMVFQPDKKDKSLTGQLRFKAARETGSIIQAMTGVGVFFNARMLGFMQDLRDASISLAAGERYKTTTADHNEGDLIAPSKFLRLATPAIVRQFQSKEKKTTKPSLKNLDKLDRLDKLDDLDKLDNLDRLDKLDAL